MSEITGMVGQVKDFVSIIEVLYSSLTEKACLKV